ncbi:MAG: Gfo/Idh/MocA family oxidoreductase [Acidobacteria bacterium]|nr:Gfo/Idh/MocA family oxidoreductase [Acidobacteriota bacterium]
MRRRHFIGAALAAGAVSANDKISVAIMGVRGRGRALAGEFAALPDVHIAALCDVDESVFERAARVVEEKKGKRPPLLGDIRLALDDKSVDAVVIAAPDHWHAPATLLACAAGKDVYVEKPASHNLREGRMMVEAARRHRRIVQVGTQSRSRPSIQRAVEFVQSGKIGKVLMAKAWNVQGRKNIGHQNDGPAPPGVDYDAWTGPARLLPFNANRFHYNWHWNWNYGTGDMGNDGVHQLDIARWALGVGHPASVSGMGRKLYFDDDQQTPDTMNITFDYGQKLMLFEMRIWNPYMMEGQENGVAVYGDRGMVHIGRWEETHRWGFKVFDDRGKLVSHDDRDEPDQHARNFIDCVRSRKAPNAEIETGHLSTLHCHLGNIVARTGRTLRFDGKTESIGDDSPASAYLGREYRKHWSTPA